MLTSKAGIRIISERIRRYRINYPMTQKQLADKSGVSLRCFQRFEKGEDIQLGNFIKILSALGLDGNVEMLVPDVAKRPSAYIEKTFDRKRVRIAKEKGEATDQFKWGDEK